jgi:spermidine/putrescine transport system permease protein
MPGVFAGSLLVFIPAVGDFVNALILGSPQTYMIGNVVQRLFLNTNAYPEASALGFLMVSAILVMILIYARVVGSEELTS